ncbi:hypothetical protein VQH23_22260 [Pararoseomonas sp. SCSIO 73927]|uniref:hypothetical protein n=1 Tax=Pararoseomonas sp. SCSIO 73927 TaxID=3114537 RepID=UPI0030CC8D96
MERESTPLHPGLSPGARSAPNPAAAALPTARPPDGTGLPAMAVGRLRHALEGEAHCLAAGLAAASPAGPPTG